jgi:hypothetical protein
MGFEAILQQLRTPLTLRPPIEYAEQVQDTSCRCREGLVTEQIDGKHVEMAVTAVPAIQNRMGLPFSAVFKSRMIVKRKVLREGVV